MTQYAANSPRCQPHVTANERFLGGIMLKSRYRILSNNSPVGWSELTQFRREDGSCTYLVRERLEFWGPVLERFVVLTFDSHGDFDSGHWVGTSDYSGDFRYSFRFDGRAIRGDWDGPVSGRCWNEVPSRPENPVLGFWGPLESLVIKRFDPRGPNRQIFDAVDVEDTHHRLLTVSVERHGTEQVSVPAGTFKAAHYSSERFGTTHHWVDESGAVIRWSSEDTLYSWDLERYPSGEALSRDTTRLGVGRYEVFSREGLKGRVSWQIEMQADGGIWILSEESLKHRISRFEGLVDAAGHWRYCSEDSHCTSPEGNGTPETQHFRTFFFRNTLYMLRLRARAYPMLQSHPVQQPFFHSVNHPLVALPWLRTLPLDFHDIRLPHFAHIGHRYRGAFLEVQDAVATNLGRDVVKIGERSVPAQHVFLRYPGGWVDSTFDYWTDERLVPIAAKISAGEGELEYRLTEYEINAAPSCALLSTAGH